MYEGNETLDSQRRLKLENYCGKTGSFPIARHQAPRYLLSSYPTVIRAEVGGLPNLIAKLLISQANLNAAGGRACTLLQLQRLRLNPTTTMI